MKYQFKNSDHKQRFSDKGDIQREIAALVGLDPFDLEGRYIASKDKDSRLAIPQGWHTTITMDIVLHCLEVRHANDEGQETREQKLQRLWNIISNGSFVSETDGDKIKISDALTLSFHDDRGMTTVGVLRYGKYCFDIFSKDEQNELYKAFDIYKMNKVKKENEDFFLNVKF